MHFVFQEKQVILQKGETMKKIIISCVITMLVATFAQAENAPSTGRFAEHKSSLLQRMNEHKTELNKEIACVSAASKPEDLRACHELGKSFRESRKSEKHQRQ